MDTVYLPGYWIPTWKLYKVPTWILDTYSTLILDTYLDTRYLPGYCNATVHVYWILPGNWIRTWILDALMSLPSLVVGYRRRQLREAMNLTDLYF